MPAFYGITNAIGPLRRQPGQRGGYVALMGQDGVAVDEVAYFDQSPWPPRPTGSGRRWS